MLVQSQVGGRGSSAKEGPPVEEAQCSVKHVAPTDSHRPPQTPTDPHRRPPARVNTKRVRSRKEMACKHHGGRLVRGVPTGFLAMVVALQASTLKGNFRQSSRRVLSNHITRSTNISIKMTSLKLSSPF
ncbi:unnamed protein product [Lota lota]